MWIASDSCQHIGRQKNKGSLRPFQRFNQCYNDPSTVEHCFGNFYLKTQVSAFGHLFPSLLANYVLVQQSPSGLRARLSHLLRSSQPLLFVTLCLKACVLRVSLYFSCSCTLMLTLAFSCLPLYPVWLSPLHSAAWGWETPFALVRMFVVINAYLDRWVTCAFLLNCRDSPHI